MNNIKKQLTKRKIYFSDSPKQVKIVGLWLKNPYSGYPNLASKLIEIIPPSPPGQAVPLDLINGCHGYSMTHNKNDLKKAYSKAWQIKNDISSSTEV